MCGPAKKPQTKQGYKLGEVQGTLTQKRKKQTTQTYMRGQIDSRKPERDR